MPIALRKVDGSALSAESQSPGGPMDREIDHSVRRNRRIRRAAWTVGILIAVVAGYVALLSWMRPSVNRSEIRTGLVERGNIEATVQASGTVIPAFERVISSPVDARVLRLLHRPGAVLEAGDAILELDTAATRLRLEEAEERIAQNANDRQQERFALQKRISQLEVEVESLAMDSEIARYRLKQNEKLHLDGLASDEALKLAEVTARKAEILSKQAKEEIGRERRANETRLERLELDARILRRQRDDLQRQLALADARAEEPGVLTWVVDEVGSLVNRGELLARVANLNAFRVEATVSDAYASRLEVGQRCHVLIGDDRLEGILSNILPTIENGAVRFQVDLQDPGSDRLRHNMKTDVLVVTGDNRDVLLAPRGPYIRGGGTEHEVFVVRNAEATRVKIRLGLSGHRHFEVLDGLEEGDELILSDMRSKLHARRLAVR